MNTHALSAISAQINGNGPYLTIDSGVTKLTTTNDLLAIKLSDGTRITPESNVSDKTPIVLPEEGQTLADIQMLVPVSADSITIDELVGPPNNYWGDDDGDTVISASGKLSIDITDNRGNKVSRSATLDVCNGPYKMTLTNTDSNIITQYGLPNSRDYAKYSTIYYIYPKAIDICYARPNLRRVSGYNVIGPANIWDPVKGFLIQSIESSKYSHNFPTTAAHNLHFDLLVNGNNPSILSWPSVTKGGITANIEVIAKQDSYFNPEGMPTVRVTFTGPVATDSQKRSESPGSLSPISLPQTFEIVGYDRSNKAVLKYGFVLKQWYVNRGTKYETAAKQASWCSSLGGYRLPQVKELTNSVGGLWPVADSPSKANNYQRNIGSGLFTEWGPVADYERTDFIGHYIWTSDLYDSKQFVVGAESGTVVSHEPRVSYYSICTYP